MSIELLVLRMEVGEWMLVLAIFKIELSKAVWTILNIAILLFKKTTQLHVRLFGHIETLIQRSCVVEVMERLVDELTRRYGRTISYTCNIDLRQCYCNLDLYSNKGKMNLSIRQKLYNLVTFM